tara:strand:- start:322 stop:984 length:663 start_codon:yes stop_codon:yes gene_type:complete
MNDTIKEIVDNAINNIEKTKHDQEIENESYLLNYHNLITENIRNNTKQITRNSFLLTISIVLYFLIYTNAKAISSISILFVKIEDNNLLLNLIPIFFSFVYLKNITLWNNNINLNFIFAQISRKIYNLSFNTDTVNIIRPFSLIQHISNFQFNNKKIPKLLKLPLTLAFAVLLFFPIIFNLIAIFLIAKNNYPTFIAYFCGIVVGVLTLATIIQALNTSK